MARPITTETRLRNRVRDLERLADSWPAILLEPDVWQFIEALSALHHIAHHSVRRPDDLGGTITGHAPHSTGARLANRPLAQLKVELTHLKQRTAMLHGELNRFDAPKAQEIA